jgi:hypothetical protein
MSKFKIKDLIKVTGINNKLNDKIKIGDTRTVTSTISDGVQLDDILDGWIHDVDIELAEDTSKPVYTQEMYDNCELPTVGMYFNCSDEINYDSRIEDFKNTEVKVIAISDLDQKKVITFYHLTMGLGCGNFLKSWVHPITPAPIELIDGNAYMFNINGTWVGFYRESRNCFFTQLINGNKIASVNECTKILPMTVAESK